MTSIIPIFLIDTVTISLIVVFGIIGVILIIALVTSIKIIDQSSAAIIQRLGRYHKTIEAGPHFIIPFLDKVYRRVSLKEQVADFDPQPVITSDNVTMQVDTVVFFQILDPRLYAYGVANPLAAIENLTATTLRNIFGEMELDETLTSRDVINQKMRLILDEATDPWGIKVNRVELKNILPPRDIQEAMEKQMRAEREKREAILRAEGEKQSNILTAQGEKESMILQAEAKKVAMIKEAEGRAEATIKDYQARAESIRLINEAAPGDAFLKLKSFECYTSLANGKATKLIVPNEIGNLVSNVSAISEAFEKSSPSSESTTKAKK